MSDKLDKVKEKIAKLMAMADNHAASEEEANKALKHAKKLLTEHSLTLEDITNGNFKRSDFVSAKRGEDRTKLHEIDLNCGPAIARFCDVKMWADRVTGGVGFFGYGVDVELAIYIRDLLIRTVEFEWNRYYFGLKRKMNGNKPAHGLTIRKQFFMGFIERIKERLAELKNEMVAEIEKGNALVVMKTALVNAAFDADMGMKLEDHGGTTYTFTDATIAGRNAGDRVKFNRAVGASTAGQKRIGK